MYTCPNCDFTTERNKNFCCHRRTCDFRAGKTSGDGVDNVGDEQMGGAAKRTRRADVTSALNGTFSQKTVHFNGANALNFERDLKEKIDEQSVFLAEQLVAKNAVKYFFCLSLNFHQSINPDYVTRPAIYLNTQADTLLQSTDLQASIQLHNDRLLEQIDAFTQSGSGWLVHELLTLELHVAEYRQVIVFNKMLSIR